MDSSDDGDLFLKQAKEIIKNKTAFCLAGGGVLGIGEVGALSRWIDHGGNLKNITHIAGASIGAVLAIAVAAGADIDWIKKLMDGLDLKKFRDGPNAIVKFWRLFKTYGWYAGDAITDFIGEMLTELVGDSEITMLELFNRNKIHLTLNYNSLNFKAAFFVDHITEPTTKVKNAGRMSSGYPVYFEAIFRKYLSDGEWKMDTIIDGGTVDNFPLHILREQGVPDSKIIGLKLCSTDQMKQYSHTHGMYDGNHYDYGEPENLVDMIERMIDMMRTLAMRIHVKSNDWILTAKINCADYSSTDFNITKEQLRDVYEAGENSIDQLILDTACCLRDGKYPVDL